jgi:acetyl esterase/lipase
MGELTKELFMHEFRLSWLLMAPVLASMLSVPTIAQEKGAAPAQTPPAAGSLDTGQKGPRALRDLEYAKPDGTALKLDLFLPANEGKPTPLVIWIHGGGWQGGSKEGCPAIGLVRDGFAVASVDYRLTDQATFPAQIFDCKAAVRFLRAHAKENNIDPERLGCWGASAGGHLVALLGTTIGEKACEGAELGSAEQSSAVQCVCDWFGPTDFREYKAQSSDVAPMLVKLFGGKMSEKQELVKLASPALHVEKSGKKYPPFLIVQGDQDPLVPWQQSQELADKLKAAGASVELVIVKGAGHGFGEQNGREFERLKKFFVEHLQNNAASAREQGPAKPAAKGS